MPPFVWARWKTARFAHVKSRKQQFVWSQAQDIFNARAVRVGSRIWMRKNAALYQSGKWCGLKNDLANGGNTSNPYNGQFYGQ